MANATEEQARECFNAFDADGSGEISARELVNMIAKVFPDMDDTDVKACAHKVMSEGDKNDDDKITFDEFKKAVCGC